MEKVQVNLDPPQEELDSTCADLDKVKGPS